MTQTASISELKQKAKLPARQAGGKLVAEFFEHNKGSVEAVLPKSITAERMLKVALYAIRAVPQLLECTTESLFGAVIQCAQLGLEPNTVLGHAYLIPFRNRKASRTDVQMIIGYRGLIDLARRSGQIVSIAAHEVCENDEFSFSYGLEERLQHVPSMGERGRVVAFYAVAHMKGGGHAFEVMSKQQVDTIMANTQSRGQYGPWKDYYVEMGRKTVIRRLSKYLPLSIEFSTAATLDGMAEAGKDQNLSAVLDGDFAVMDENAPSGDGEPGDDDPQREEPAEETSAKTAPAQEWPQQFTDKETGEVGWQDASGVFFNPSQHSMGSNGVPAIRQDGTFRARRGAGKDASRGSGGDGEEGFGGME